MKSVWVAVSVAASVGAFIGGCGLSASSPGAASASGPSQEKVQPLDPSNLETSPAEETENSLEDSKLRSDAEVLVEALRGTSSLVSVFSDVDEGKVVVYWYGNDRSALEGIMSSVGSPVEVRSAPYDPQALHSAAEFLLATDLGINVSATSVEPGGSGILVSLLSAPSGEALEEVAVRLSTLVGFPVEIDLNGPVPAKG